MIIINKKGFFCSNWNEKKRKYEKRKLTDAVEIISHWNSVVKYENEITLEQFMSFLCLNEDLLKYVGILTNSNIDKYIKELKEEKTQKPFSDQPEITHICLQKCVQITDYTKYCKDILNSIEIQEWVDCFGRSEHSEESWALEFTHWSLLKDSIITIEKKAKFYSDVHDAKDEQYDYSIKFGEFLSSLFNELCFFSSPEDREIETNILLERVEEAKDPNNLVEIDLDTFFSNLKNDNDSDEEKS